MKSLETKNNRGKKTPILIGLIVLTVVIAAAFYFFYWKNKDATTDNSGYLIGQDTPKQPDTKESESEETKFPVPADTPEESIKDYSLLTENDQFKIRRNQDSDQYIITLYAIINNPDQYDSYIAQLKDQKQQALDYIKSQGKDPATLSIIYEPPEAQNL